MNVRGDRWLGGLVEVEVHPPAPRPTPTPAPDPATPVPVPDGIVRNASFEIGRSPWYLNAGAYRTTQKVHGGGLAIALKSDGGFADQAIKVTAGASYELSVWGAMSNAWDVGYAGVVFRDAKGVRLTSLEPPMIEFTHNAYRQKALQFQVDKRVEKRHDLRLEGSRWRPLLRGRHRDPAHRGSEHAADRARSPAASRSWFRATSTRGRPDSGTRRLPPAPASGWSSSTRTAAWVTGPSRCGSRSWRRRESAGFTVLGYVQTDYGTRSASAVIAEMDTYRKWYGVRDFFLDEADTRFESLERYRAMATNIHDGGGIAVLNFGWAPHPSYMQFTDIAGVYESNYRRVPG